MEGVGISRRDMDPGPSKDGWMDTYYRSSDYILQVWFESEEDFQVVQIKFDEKTFMGFRKATQLFCAADQVRGGAHQGRARLCRHRRPDHRCVGGWSKCWRGVPATARSWALVIGGLIIIEICQSCVAKKKSSKFQ